MSFLKAEWRKLAIANYKIKEFLLQKYLPAGTELDILEGNCFVSLVGFMFVNTKVLVSSQGLTLGLLAVILNLDKEKNVIIVNYNEAF